MEIGIELVLYVHTYVYLVSNVCIYVEKVGEEEARKKSFTLKIQLGRIFLPFLLRLQFLSAKEYGK